MKELDLNDLSPDATEAVKAVIGILTGKDHDTHVYQGKKYLFSVHRANEGEIEPGIIAGAPAEMSVSEIFDALDGCMDEERLKDIEKGILRKDRSIHRAAATSAVGYQSGDKKA